MRLLRLLLLPATLLLALSAAPAAQASCGVFAGTDCSIATTFPDTAVGSSSSAQTITLTNDGGPTLQITAVSMAAGGDSAAFTIGTDNCTGQTLNASATCTVDVTFSPPSKDGYDYDASASLSVTTDVPMAPPTMAQLAGHAIDGGPAPPLAGTLTPTTYSFADTAIGATSSAATFHLTSNATSGTLDVSSVTITGTNAADFTVTSNGCVNAHLGSTGSCDVDVAFAPTGGAARTASATLEVASNAPTVTATLSGNATAMTSTAAPTIASSNATSGLAKTGDTLTCGDGSWSATPDSRAWAWQRGGTAIDGQTASTYTVRDADAGKSITCSVTATKGGVSVGSAASSAIDVPAAATVTIGTPTKDGVAMKDAITTKGSWTLPWTVAGGTLTGCKLNGAAVSCSGGTYAFDPRPSRTTAP